MHHRRLRASPVGFVLVVVSASAAALGACEGTMGGGSGGATGSGGDGAGTPCIDLDGDGYGTGCVRGPDCDDANPTVTTDCSTTGFGGGSAGGLDAAGGTGGTERTPFHPSEDNSSGVHVDDDGALTLESQPEIQPAVWIANDEEGTVSRLDAATGRETGRYPSLVTGREVRADPSRTAIDFRGDCWVANRFRDTPERGSVTKIASRIEDCVDRDGDGEITTSRDLDGDGRISLGSEEFPNAEDECVLFTVEVGEPGGIARALAIAPDARGRSSAGNAWVGLNMDRTAVEVDGDTGEVIRTVPLPLNPYGALASKYEGRVWFVNAGWQSDLPDNPPAIVAVDYRTGEVTPRYDVESTNGCVGTYGITIDPVGRVWVGGNPCHDTVFGYDPRVGEWTTVDIPDSGRSRGLVADAEGWVWVAFSWDCPHDRCGLVSRFRADSGDGHEHFRLPTGAQTIGVDLDVFGRVWVVNKSSDNASRIDPVTGVIDEFPTGDGPYTYSDFTGHSLLLQFPRGYYRDVIEACPGAHWTALHVDADTPGDTSVEVRVRTAEERIDLAGAPWLGPWSDEGGDLQAPPGPVLDGAILEMELTLLTNEDALVPRVRAVDFTYRCPVR